MREPSKMWWQAIKQVADSYAEQKPEGYLEKEIKERMFQISCAIEDLLAIL